MTVGLLLRTVSTALLWLLVLGLRLCNSPIASDLSLNPCEEKEGFFDQLDIKLGLPVHDGSSHQGCPVCLRTHPLGVPSVKRAPSSAHL